MKTYSIKGIPLRTNYLELDYNPELKERARALRKARNLPEVVFWMHVNKGQFHGLDFDRQRIIGNFIVDFYIKSLGLVIEIDGDSHANNDTADEARQKWIEAQGCHVFRVPAYMAQDFPGHVLSELEKYILTHFT